MRRKTFTTAASLALIGGLLAGAPASQAAFIVQPDSSTGTGSAGNTPQVHSFDGSGLSDATIVQDDDPVPSTWPTHNTDKFNVTWVSDKVDMPGQGEITFDLGQAYELTSMHVWNYNPAGTFPNTSRGIEDVDVSFSTDNVAFGSTESFTFTQAPGSTSYRGEDYDLANPVNARWVRFDVQSVHAGTSNLRIGLSEVRFTAIPEPASLALLGLGGLAMLPRRRWA